MSVEAADIYKNEQENGAVVGYRLPEKGDARFRLCQNIGTESNLRPFVLEHIFR